MSSRLTFGVYLRDEQETERLLACFVSEPDARHYAESIILGLARSHLTPDHSVRIDRQGETIEELGAIPFVV